MADFVRAALGFPTGLLSFLLIVVIGYWLLAVLGAVDIGGHGHDGIDLDAGGHGGADLAAHGHGGADLAAHGHGGADGDGAAHDGHDGHDGGVLHRLGLGGVPISIVVSLIITFAWFVSLAGAALAAPVTPMWIRVVLGVLVLVAALVIATVVTAILVRPLRRLFDSGPAESRQGFVGLECVIRTGRVDDRFGQAEVTAADGSSAVIQVRQSGAEALRSGSHALIYDYDPDGEVFWVTATPGGPVAGAASSD